MRDELAPTAIDDHQVTRYSDHVVVARGCTKFCCSGTELHSLADRLRHMPHNSLNVE